MKLLNLLSRYVSRLFLSSFSISLLCLLIIIVLFDFAELQRRVGSKEMEFSVKLAMVFLRVPHFLEQVLPFLIFIAALFVFWRMNRANELLVCRSAGVSLWRLILPISVAALIVGFIDLSGFNPLSCAMHSRYEKLEKRYFSKSKDEVRVSPTGLWLSEKLGVNQAIYRASKVNLTKLEFQDLNIIIISPQNKFLERIDAKSAQIKDNTLEAREGWEIKEGKTPEFFTQKTISTSLDKKKIENMKITHGSFSFWKLPAYIELLDASGLQSVKYRMVWHSMLASSFWGGGMVLLAAAFSCRPHRQGRTVLMILLGLIIGFFLYFFKDMVFALGSSGRLPPIIAAWLPLLITIMVGAVLIFNQEDG